MKTKNIKKQIISLLFILLLPSIAVGKYDDLTIVVSSCDKYAALWEPFFGSLFKHWPSLNLDNSDTPIILIANKQKYQNPRVQMINIPNESSWTDNILTALQHVETKYVLLALDDYWLNTDIDEERFTQLYEVMRAEDAAMLQTSANDLRYQTGALHSKIPGLMYRNKYAHYKVSLQLAIWDKQALLDLLRPGENPWEFELAGTIRSHGYPRTVFTVSKNEPITYINATFQGHIRPEAIEHATANNFSFKSNSFPTLTGFNPKLTAKIWHARFEKLIAFVKHPGFFVRTQ